MIQKYLPPSPATTKGMIKKPQATVRSTRPKQKNAKCAPTIFKSEADFEDEEGEFVSGGGHDSFVLPYRPTNKRGHYTQMP